MSGNGNDPYLNKHLDAARGTLWTIRDNSLPLQMKSFGQKEIQISCMS